MSAVRVFCLYSLSVAFQQNMPCSSNACSGKGSCSAFSESRESCDSSLARSGILTAVGWMHLCFVAPPQTCAAFTLRVLVQSKGSYYCCIEYAQEISPTIQPVSCRENHIPGAQPAQTREHMVKLPKLALCILCLPSYMYFVCFSLSVHQTMFTK